MKTIANSDLQTLISLLRFGPNQNTNNNQVFLSLEIIARFLKISTFKLSLILKQSNSDKPKVVLSKQGRKKILSNDHIAFLLSQQTLIEWAGFSIKERCVLFHRKYPEAKISYSYLQRLYKAHKIKFKIIKQQKLTSKIDPQKLNDLTQSMKMKVVSSINYHKKLIFLDEAIFSPQTLLQRTWSLKNDNIRQLDMRQKIKTQALLSAISADYGLDLFIIRERSINQQDFIVFLQKIKDRYNQEEIVIFMDNLSVHKTQLVVQKMKDLNITPIYNVPYSPQYNGIESYFYLVKQQYKKILLQRILKGKYLNTVTMIKQAIDKVDDDKVMNCAQYGINEIMKIN